MEPSCLWAATSLRGLIGPELFVSHAEFSIEAGHQFVELLNVAR